MDNARLKAVTTSLETKAGAVTVANDGKEGWWKRIAAAAEDIANAVTLANDSLEGYQLRTAKALEATAGTTGAEETMTSAGFIKRIVDALEVKAGAVGTTDILDRFVTAAQNAVFAVQAALDLNFATATYKASGTTYGSLAAVPGYAYTRTGVKAEQNANTTGDIIDDFAANAPGVASGVGYWSRAAFNNFLLHSSDLTNAAWTKSGATVAGNAVTAPDNTLTADTVTMNGGNDTVYNFVATTASTQYTVSFYVRRGTATDLKFSIYSDAIGADVIASTSYYAQTSATEWRRITFTFTTPAGATNIRVALVRDSLQLGTVHFWGVQIVLGAEAGPLLATTTAAAASGADSLAFGLANGSYTAVYTFADNTTEGIPTTIAAGVFTVANPRSKAIKSLVVNV